MGHKAASFTSSEGTVGWLIAEAGEVPEGDNWLAVDEAATLARLAVPGRRADYRLGRWAAKQALAAWMGLDLPRDIEDRALALARLAVLPAPDGAPEAWLDGTPAPVALSFGHRAGRAACTVACEGTALGCDLERIEPRSGAFVRDYFTGPERALLAADPEAGRPLLANLLWSAKESALKALRTGLRFDTRDVEVTLGEGEQDGWHPLAVHHAATGRTFHGWWRRDGNHVITLAADPAPPPPRWLGSPTG